MCVSAHCKVGIGCLCLGVMHVSRRGGVDCALEFRMTCVGDYELNHHVYRTFI